MGAWQFYLLCMYRTNDLQKNLDIDEPNILAASATGDAPDNEINSGRIVANGEENDTVDEDGDRIIEGTTVDNEEEQADQLLGYFNQRDAEHGEGNGAPNYQEAYFNMLHPLLRCLEPVHTAHSPYRLPLLNELSVHQRMRGPPDN